MSDLRPAPPLESRYQLLRELGRSVTGVRWEALDRTDGHRVFVHQLPQQQVLPPGGAERFLAEGEQAGRLGHQHLVAVEERADRALVLELLSGRSLAAVIAAGPADLGLVLIWAQQACLALKAAHGAGLVHWAVKPSRFFLTDQGRIKLGGFGRAHLAPATETGNAPYLAPEQWRQAPADGRADLYALGCVLFELCAGRPPYLGSSAGELMHRHLNDAVPYPGLFRGYLPAGLDQVVLALLAKDPAARPADAAEAAARLGEVAAGYHGPLGTPVAAPVPAAAPPMPAAPPVVPPVPPQPPQPPQSGPPAPANPFAPPSTPTAFAPPSAAGLPGAAGPVEAWSEERIREQVDQAWAIGEAGRSGEAVQWLTGLVVQSAAALGPAHPQTLQVCYDLAIWRGMADDLAGAAGLLAELVPLMIAALGPGHEDVARATRDLWSYQRDLERRRNRAPARPGELAMLLGRPPGY
ncbi:serine/threonine-protein kinase [Kitasatospora sp. LaBMicrA B282]|uniref:serine/threonine-protein kinase n=1 Tax=Kitasatospora sp. LaBMicrA B282 TaxID=3420949 RepID=UPI003D122EE3